MTHQATLAKVDRLMEAFEDLAIGVSADELTKVAGEDGDPSARKQVTEHLAAARVELREALIEYLQPITRLVEDGAHQDQTHVVPLTDQVRCKACQKRQPCQPRCPAWALAVKAKVATPPDEPDDDPPLKAA